MNKEDLYFIALALHRAPNIDDSEAYALGVVQEYEAIKAAHQAEIEKDKKGGK